MDRQLRANSADPDRTDNCLLCLQSLSAVSRSVWGRPFDILGGGAWVIFQKNFLSLVLKEKNNLSLKRVKKNNLSLKRAKKITWPGLRKKKKNILAHNKGKVSILFYFVMCRWLLGGYHPPDPPYIYINYIYAKHLVKRLFLSFFILSSPHLIFIIVLFYLSTLKSINLRPFSFLYNTNVFFLGNIVYKTNLRPL